MKSALFFTSAIAALFNIVTADVVGAAEGFAKGVTGGKGGSEVTPTTTDELVSYLGDDEARIIYISKTFDFTGTEGTTSESNGCAAWGTDAACQVAINQNDWCKNYQPDAPSADVTYDNAATLAIKVGSNKSIVGVGSSGVLKGKGLRVVGGAKNVIIQNIKITELNPQYVWGGDAITLNDVDMVWIDHVTTSLIGRQHIVLGTNACGRVTISNCHIDGSTSWSATCDGYHYWALYFAGSNDVSVVKSSSYPNQTGRISSHLFPAQLVTFKNNYIYHTSGRSPKVSGNTVLHAVNNYWYDNSGHAFEIDNGGMVVAEGNVFQNVNAPVEDGYSGQLFSSPSAGANAVCESYLGHVCETNGFGSSGSFEGSDSSFLSNFGGKNVATAEPYSVAKDVQTSAGFGQI